MYVGFRTFGSLSSVLPRVTVRVALEFYLIGRCWVVLVRAMSTSSGAPSPAVRFDDNGGGRQGSGIAIQETQDLPIPATISACQFGTFGVYRCLGVPER